MSSSVEWSDNPIVHGTNVPVAQAVPVDSKNIESSKSVETAELSSLSPTRQLSRKASNYSKLESGNINKRPMYENEVGMTPNVESLTENPNEFLQRYLEPGETVIETFDCYFPTRMIPKWKLILLCITTLGFYLLVLAYRAVARWCYRMRFCYPSLYVLERGKMCITSKGRIIYWDQKVEQIKIDQGCGALCFKCCTCGALCCRDICAAPMHYNIRNTATALKVDQICQVSQFYQSSAAFFLFWCCCISFECGVEVSFHKFNESHLKLFSYVRVSRSGSVIAAYLSAWVEYGTKIISTAIEGVINLHGMTSNDNVMYIVSTSKDMVRNDNKNFALEDIASLYGRVIDCLPDLPDAFVKNSSIEGEFPARTKKFQGVSIVDDKLSVTIPESCFKLLPNEEIHNSCGLAFSMTLFDWFLSICSFGLYYLIVLRWKKFNRTALVLTNKRLVCIDLNQRIGTIPEHLSSFQITVTSYLPFEVYSGYIYSRDDHHLETIIHCKPGTILIDFPYVSKFYKQGDTRKKYYPFIKSLHMTTSRMNSSFNNEENACNLFQFDDVNKPFLSDRKILSNIPLLPDESLLDAVQGVMKWQQFLDLTFWFPFCYFPGAPPDYLCYDRREEFPPIVSKCLFPLCPLILTCALRPFRKNSDIIVTEKTVIQLIRLRNFGLCGFFSPISENKTLTCRKDDYFIVAWAPSNALKGHTVSYNYRGNERWQSRLFKDTQCGKYFCPITDASYDIVIHMNNDVDLSTSGQDYNINWKNEKRILSAQKSLNLIQNINR